MTEQAVLDRIEDQQHAVLLVGATEEERVVPVGQLPPGCRPGDWLVIETDDRGRFAIQIDPQATEQAANRIRDKMKRLKGRGRKLG